METCTHFNFDYKTCAGETKSTHVVHVPGGAILPAEMDQGVVRLLDVDLTFTLVGSHRAALHRHFTGPELHQEFAGGAAGARHHAGKQSSRCHDDDDDEEEGSLWEEEVFTGNM